MLVDLPVKDGKVTGALCIKEEEVITFVYLQAKTIILGTGSGLFKINLFPEGMAGDGYAAALRGCAELVDMELLSGVKDRLRKGLRR